MACADKPKARSMRDSGACPGVASRTHSGRTRSRDEFGTKAQDKVESTKCPKSRAKSLAYFTPNEVLTWTWAPPALATLTALDDASS